MKKLVTILVLSLNAIGFSQSRETISVAKGKTVDFKIEKNIDNGTDTTLFFFWGFKNAKYEMITDVGGFFYVSKSDLTAFVEGLRNVANKEHGSNYMYTVPKGSFILYDFNPNNVYIKDKNDKYCIIPKNKLNAIADEISNYIELFK